MTKSEVRRWLSRWKAVEARQRREAQNMTPTEKLEECARLFAWVKAFRWNRRLQAEEQQVRDLWTRLRRAYRADR